MVNSPEDTQLVRGKVAICSQDGSNCHPFCCSFSPKVCVFVHSFQKTNFRFRCFSLFLRSLICVLVFIPSFCFLSIYCVVPFVTSQDGSEFITFQSFFLAALNMRNFPLSPAVVASHTFALWEFIIPFKIFSNCHYDCLKLGRSSRLADLQLTFYGYFLGIEQLVFMSVPPLGSAVQVSSLVPQQGGSWSPGPTPVGCARLEALTGRWAQVTCLCATCNFLSTRGS